uniref:Cytochrome c oxidase subunit 2 n=1 Tax=Neomysis japonica TaxID=1676841 RepID=A0A0U2DB20_9CRUS|nr:cytochrome c oxidase subunit II [Neomysis japonica]AKO62607.1 cytochrome c oxidase subunit II [Neomysis japonica]
MLKLAYWKSLEFNNAASPQMEELILFHDHTMVILVAITVFVMYMMSMFTVNVFTDKFLLENHKIEVIWTVLPAVLLLFIGFPSLRLLYILDETSPSMITLKVIGHQWYWSYEYSDTLDLEFDSYMLPSDEAMMDQFRVLDVDNRIILPINTPIRVIVSAADVLHSWTVPSLGVKVDAVPGRLNQTSFLLKKPGLFMGQCSEICGANHSFMPIVVESITTNMFLKWILNN